MMFDTMGESLAWYSSCGYRTRWDYDNGVAVLTDSFGNEVAIGKLASGKVMAQRVPARFRRGRQYFPTCWRCVAVGATL